MPDPDLKIWGGGGASVWSRKSKGGRVPRAPPMDPPLLIVVVLIDSFRVLFVCFSLFFCFSFYLPMFLFVCFSFFDFLIVSFLPFSLVKIESR